MTWYDPGITAHTHMGADRKTLSGAAQSVTIPAGSKFVEISAENGDVRIAVDGTATSSSPLIVAQYAVRVVWLVGNTSLSVFGTDCYANFNFYG